MGIDFIRIGSRSAFHVPYSHFSVLSHYDVDFCSDNGVLSVYEAEKFAKDLEEAPEPTLDQTRSRLVAGQGRFGGATRDDASLKELIRFMQKERRKLIRFLRRDGGPIYCDM